jgi:hypothetical protein
MKQEGYLEIKGEYEPCDGMWDITEEGGGGGISDGYYCINVGGGSSDIPLN